jgi:hypothetical protein
MELEEIGIFRPFSMSSSKSALLCYAARFQEMDADPIGRESLERQGGL